MPWCTGALMHWWCIVWHCSGALWICDSIEVQFYTLWKSAEIWEIVITFGDFDPQLWWPISFFSKITITVGDFDPQLCGLFQSSQPQWQVNLSVGRSSQLALTTFLIQGKYIANQRYFEAQTRATGLASFKHFSVAWTRLDWKYLQFLMRSKVFEKLWSLILTESTLPWLKVEICRRRFFQSLSYS